MRVGFNFVKLHEMSQGQMKALLDLIEDHPIKYNLTFKAFSSYGSGSHYESELGDPDGQKFEAVKSRIVSGLQKERSSCVDLELLSNEGRVVPFQLSIFSVENYTSISIAIEHWQNYPEEDLLSWFQPLFIDFFRHFELDVGFLFQQDKHPDYLPSTESLKSERLSPLKKINYYLERFRKNLPPHKGKEILLNKEIGLFRLVLEKDPEDEQEL